MLEKALRGAWLGSVIGVLSAIIAFLIAYNALIIQISNQKDEIAEAYRRAKESSDLFATEKAPMRKTISELRDRVEQLESRVSLIGKASLYKDIEVRLPQSDTDIQKLYAFLNSNTPRTKEEKATLYSYALKSDIEEIRHLAYKALITSASNEDLLSILELTFGMKSTPPDLHYIDESVLSCGEDLRSIVLVKLKEVMNESYSDNDKPNYMFTYVVRVLSKPSGCLSQKEISSLILIAKNHSDREMVAELNGYIARLSGETTE